MPVIGERRARQKGETDISEPTSNAVSKKVKSIIHWAVAGAAHLDFVDSFTKFGFGPTADSDVSALGRKKLGECETETL